MALVAGDRARFSGRALRKRCPQCGEGKLFRGFARLHERCPHCGLVYRRESGSQTGAMYISAAVSELFAALVALSLFFFTDWSTTVALTVGVLFVVTFSYTFLPIAMSAWVAVEYTTDVMNGERWVDPRRE
jgi:uncharacterized protein (DUF983 family)